jgi:bcr-type benzoyl-CoA reductase subunit B
MTKFNSVGLMKQIMGTYFITMKNTKQPIAWVTSGAPVEFLYAMDVLPVYPENYAAMCGASHQSLALCEAAEAEGFSADICSYARTDFGADITKGGPLFGLPKPDMLLCSTNICKTVQKWYEVIARKYNCPLIMVDTPFLHDGLTQHLIDYTVDQFKALEDFLAKFTGRPFDQEKFMEVLQLSMEATQYWQKTLLYGKTKPSPFNSNDTFLLLGPIVTLRGTADCLKFYKALYEEIAERAENKVGSLAEEKYRVLWDNLPIWFKVRRLSEFFDERKTALVVATYTNSWAGPEDADESNIYEELAKAYLKPYINSGFDFRINYLAKLINDFDLTGFILHSDRSCKPYSIGMYRMQEEVSKLTGRPGVVIEGDMCDPRAYSDAQTETRLEAFIESMEPVS